MSRRRRRTWLTLGILAAMVNLPLVFGLLTSWRIHADGVDVEATVVRIWDQGAAEDPEHWVSFRLPPRLDPGRQVQAAPVTEETQVRARKVGTVPVRVLPDQPTTWRVDGQAPRRAGLWLTVAADLLIGLVAWWTWYAGRRDDATPVLRLEATADVEAAADGDVASVTTTETGEHVVCGVVIETDVHEVVLDVEDGQVVVILDGRANPVLPGEAALARGRALPD